MGKSKQNMTGTREENKPHTTAIEVEGENMAQAIELSTANRKKAMMKASILVAFIIVAIYIVRFTPVKGYLTAEALGRFLDMPGFGPLLRL